MMTIENIGDILSILNANAQSDSEELRRHAQTLMGPRQRGSTTQLGLESISPDRLADRVTHPCVEKDCECYRVYAPELKGVIGVVPAGEALSGSGVLVRSGQHGDELICYKPRPSLLKRVRVAAAYIYIIVGRFEVEPGVFVPALFTWHPGEPLRPYHSGCPVTADTGVKLV